MNSTHTCSDHVFHCVLHPGCLTSVFSFPCLPTVCVCACVLDGVSSALCVVECTSQHRELVALSVAEWHRGPQIEPNCHRCQFNWGQIKGKWGEQHHSTSHATDSITCSLRHSRTLVTCSMSRICENAQSFLPLLLHLPTCLLCALSSCDKHVRTAYTSHSHTQRRLGLLPLLALLGTSKGSRGSTHERTTTHTQTPVGVLQATTAISFCPCFSYHALGRERRADQPFESPIPLSLSGLQT